MVQVQRRTAKVLRSRPGMEKERLEQSQVRWFSNECRISANRGCSLSRRLALMQER